MTDILQSLDSPVNPNIPELRPGDMVSVHLRIKEGTTERIQEFKGTIIRQHARGNSETFTVRRIASNGIGVERTATRTCAAPSFTTCANAPVKTPA
jgi:large subunit ribosomal protein L19